MNIFMIVYLLCITCLCNCYKFLLVFPLPVKSLNILGEGIAKHLVNAGHEVTYVSVFSVNNMSNKFFKQINVIENLNYFNGSSIINISSLMMGEMPQQDLHMLRRFALDTATMTFKNEKMQKFLLDRTQKFDAVIADLYETEVYAGLAVLYECPMIWSYSMGAHYVPMHLIDGPTNPAYVPDYLSSNVSPLTFVQRVEELWAYIKWFYGKRFYTQPEEKAIFKSVFEPLLTQNSKETPLYEEIIYNASLIFANDHTGAGNVPKVPANFKFIGGQHIDKYTKPLPKGLQTLMDNAKDGVIYFSMGSTWQSKDFPQTLVDGLFKVFGELKQTVLWKFEADLPNVPQNVHILKWAPQPSILAHPKCSIFITHGGLLSSLETIHYGVPIIGIPIYFDQFVNINKAVAQGYALSVDLNFNLHVHLHTAINKMLNDKKYAKRAKEISMIYHDRLVSPEAELVHWVEHVVRTRGAPHLRSPALHLAWYQKTFLDLGAIILFILMVIKMAINLLISSNPSKKKIDSKKRS